MSSIGSILQTLNTSLVSEINTFNKTQPSSTTSTSTSSDSVGVSQFAQLMQQLQQLQTSNPTEFKQVMSDAATQLKTAAAQSTDPAQATFLTNLSDQFQNAATTGNLSALQSQSGTAGTYAHHGHHHHHGGAPPTDSSSTSSTTGTTTTPTDLASLLSQMLGNTQTGTNGQANTQSQALISSLFSAMQ
jgi:hypothetical protein